MIVNDLTDREKAFALIGLTRLHRMYSDDPESVAPRRVIYEAILRLVGLHPEQIAVAGNYQI